MFAQAFNLTMHEILSSTNYALRDAMIWQLCYQTVSSIHALVLTSALWGNTQRLLTGFLNMTI